MGEHHEQKDLFSYQVDLDKRVRKSNPLRVIKESLSFEWVRDEVRRFYGYNGNVSVDPVIIVKLLFLLFYDNVRSERELMRIVPERLDYLWFLGLGIDDEIPDHSVVSKARRRWGRDVFEKLFVRTVRDCVEAGLVDGSKIHVDGSLVDADASKDSVVRGPEELIAALRAAYGAQEQKLDGNLGDPNYKPQNRKLMSTTDPDAPCVRHGKKGGSGDSRPRYKHHRAVDDKCGVITAIETTTGDVEENSRAEALVDQHEATTGRAVETFVADQQYGTADNYRRLQKRGIRTHMGQMHSPGSARRKEIFPMDAFTYDAEADCYICPAGKKLQPKSFNERRQLTDYKARKSDCASCPLRSQCTRSKTGRTIARHLNQELIDEGKRQASSDLGRKDRRRRRYLGEGSFADATRHHFKRARWRTIKRHGIQDLLIASIQNIKILVGSSRKGPKAAERALFEAYHPRKRLLSRTLFPPSTIISRITTRFNVAIHWVLPLSAALLHCLRAFRQQPLQC